jgi:hypothetical protein
VTRAEAVRSGLLAAAVAIPLAVLGPTGGDVPAHLYRTLLVREGDLVWDNLWYAGHYPLASYSLLYYLPATVFGNLPLAVAAAVAAAFLFASVAEKEWGERVRWPSRAFAVAAAGPIFTGTYTYALGLAALLGSLKAVQAGRIWLGILLAALTMGFSPLAFVFLCIALGAVGIARRRLDRPALMLASAVGLVAAVQALALWLFPHDAFYPFRLLELGVVFGIGVLGAALCARVPRAQVVGALFGLWALASVAVFLVPSPIGENVTRLRGVVFPLMLLGAVLVRFRPIRLAVPALAGALAYTLVPYVAVIPHRTDGRPAEAAYWQPALDFVRGGTGAGFRVEVVPTGDHWEAYWVPKAGVALARGWYRQLDIAQNPLFYRAPLDPGKYRAWLRSMGVRYVLLPDTQLGRYGEEREADLLRSGRSGLIEVFTTADWRVFELPDATPILSGPAGASLTALEHERIAGSTRVPGDYRLAVRFTPYWRVSRGDVCLERAADGMTRLSARRAGPFELVIDESPGALLHAVVNRRGDVC